MSNNVLSILNQIQLANANVLSNFLKQLKYVLNTLDVQDFQDIAEGLRRYLKLESSIENDLLINRILAMLASVYFYTQGETRSALLLEINNIRFQNPEDIDIQKFVSIIEYFINNFADIVSTTDKENDIHRKKLILMERVNKFIEDKEIRDKTLDLMLLMNN